MKAGILTLSDKGHRGERVDTSGPAIREWLTARGVEVAASALLPDDEDAIAERLAQWADARQLDLILTTGGTGVSPRDVTPEATLRVASLVLPGFGEAMRAASMKRTPHGMISRAVAVIRNQTLIVNLPGSPRAAIENLEVVWPAIPHTVAKLKGDMADCAPVNSAT